jgi:hypothetical protein
MGVRRRGLSGEYALTPNRAGSALSWRNRIVGSGVKPASEFMANPDNWRVHPSA